MPYSDSDAVYHHCSALEAVTPCAWPALEEDHMGPFLLRYSGGFTKRANCAVLRHTAIVTEADIAGVEAWYAKRNHPAIFRIPAFSSCRLDVTLARRGYTKQDRSLVMTHDLSQNPGRQASDTSIRLLAFSNWLEYDNQLCPRTPHDRTMLEQILSRNSDCTDYVLLEDERSALACGLGVRMHGRYALFNIRTAQQYRRQGHGTALVSAMLHSARGHGMKEAWLQVLESNMPAIGLYTSLGFVSRYLYWYRIRHE